LSQLALHRAAPPPPERADRGSRAGEKKGIAADWSAAGMTRNSVEIHLGNFQRAERRTAVTIFVKFCRVTRDYFDASDFNGRHCRALIFKKHRGLCIKRIPCFRSRTRTRRRNSGAIISGC